MKTVNSIRGYIVAAGLALAAVGLVSAPVSAQAQMKGAEKLMQLQQVNTVDSLQKVDAGDTIITSCPKCKESYATVVEKTFKAVKPEELKTVSVHLCDGCDTKLVTKGHGKAATQVLVHTCRSCGSKDVSCCVMKKGGGSTPGMDEKK